VIVDQNVGGLNVTVNHPMQVGVFESIRNFSHPSDRLLRSRWILDEMIAKAATGDKLRHDEAQIAILPYIEHLNHAGMLNPCHSPSLSHESIGGKKPCRLRHFDSNDTLKFEVVALPDLSKSSLGNEGIEAISAC
jgi:hypothetical protein